MNLKSAKVYHDGSRFIGIPTTHFLIEERNHRGTIFVLKRTNYLVPTVRPKPRKNGLKRLTKKVFRHLRKSEKNTLKRR